MRYTSEILCLRQWARVKSEIGRKTCSVIDGFAGNSAFKTDEYFAKLASPLFLGFLTVKASEGRHSAFFPSVTEGGKEVLWKRSFVETEFCGKEVTWKISFVEKKVCGNGGQREF